MDDQRLRSFRMKHFTHLVYLTFFISFDAFSSGAKLPVIPPSQTPIITSGTASETNSYSEFIKNLAQNSTCAKYNWKNRGRAPAGYIKGMALSYAKSYCRLKSQENIFTIMSSSVTSNPAKDALAYFKSSFDSLQIPLTESGEGPLRSVYVLGIGLGMRESSGKYCEGWDQSAGSNRPSRAAEAGLFQSSYDSIGVSSELSKLYSEYKENGQASCFLETFKEGVKCKSQNILGSGEGADFQKFNLKCPAFATEYAMTMLRVIRSHYGPINRKEAQVEPSCNNLLIEVEDFISKNAYACDDII